eukprot:jgi/Hompol1/2833/HPOL_006179-RA
MQPVRRTASTKGSKDKYKTTVEDDLLAELDSIGAPASGSEQASSNTSRVASAKARPQSMLPTATSSAKTAAAGASTLPSDVKNSDNIATQQNREVNANTVAAASGNAPVAARESNESGHENSPKSVLGQRRVTLQRRNTTRSQPNAQPIIVADDSPSNGVAHGERPMSPNGETDEVGELPTTRNVMVRELGLSKGEGSASGSAAGGLGAAARVPGDEAGQNAGSQLASAGGTAATSLAAKRTSTLTRTRSRSGSSVTAAVSNVISAITAPTEMRRRVDNGFNFDEDLVGVGPTVLLDVRRRPSATPNK